MFSWISNKIGLNKKTKSKTPSPVNSKPKTVSIFNSISYLSSDGEKNSPINLTSKPKKKKKNPKSWSKKTGIENNKSIVRASNRLRNDVHSNLGLYPTKPLTPIAFSKNAPKSLDQTRSILKKSKPRGGKKTKKRRKHRKYSQV